MIENPGKQAILCAGESNQHLFVATQDKHLFVISKVSFTMIKVYSTLQLVNCLTRIDSSSGCIILIGMVQKYFGSIKILENSFDFEEMDLQAEVGHCLAVRQIVFDQQSQSFLISHFGKKLEYWRVVNFEDADSRAEVVHGRHLYMELINWWDRDVGILGQSGNNFICFDNISKHFCVINLQSQQIYKKVNLIGVPNSVIDMKILKQPVYTSKVDKSNSSIPPFDALLRLSSYTKEAQM